MGLMFGRLSSKLWIDAHVRTCFNQDMPTFIISKGDIERGGIILKINHFTKGVDVLERGMDFDGNTIWRPILHSPFEIEIAADEAIKKRLAFDDDLWVLEIEDPQNKHHLHEKVETL